MGTVVHGGDYQNCRLVSHDIVQSGSQLPQYTASLLEDNLHNGYMFNNTSILVNIPAQRSYVGLQGLHVLQSNPWHRHAKKSKLPVSTSITQFTILVL